MFIFDKINEKIERNLIYINACTIFMKNRQKNSLCNWNVTDANDLQYVIFLLQNKTKLILSFFYLYQLKKVIHVKINFSITLTKIIQ